MIDEAKLRQTIADNLIYYRKRAGLTQAELAATLNYSDKSVSKWERGDGIPDVIVLSILADYYSIEVGDLLHEREDQPQEASQEPPKKRSLRAKILVPILSVGIAWLSATFLFFLLKVIFPSLPVAGPVFTWCVPVSFIILTVFAAIWWNQPLRFVCISGIEWSVALSLYLTFCFAPYMVLIFAVAGVMELLTILWFILRAPRKSSSQKGDNRSEKMTAS
ncbi:MAG: helix-turn-helix domain-containing protein [Eubacteriales bacterium]